MTLAERVAPVARTLADARLGRRLRRAIPAISEEVAGPVDQVVDAIATIGAFNVSPPAEPWNVASPKLKTPPSFVRSQ